MVLRELVELAPAQAIDPAVSDVRNAHAFIGTPDRNDCGAHALLACALLRGTVNSLVRRSNGARQLIRRTGNSFNVFADKRQ